MNIHQKFWAKYVGNRTVADTYAYFCTIIAMLIIWCLILSIALIIK
tara:strand:- start:422 stop:559 length:138 start_codon:yes stop_codon:yes gene_type:complete